MDATLPHGDRKSAASITLESLHKQFPDGTVAVESLDLHVNAGELTVLIGPSGCGKSTVLRMINQLVPATGGRVLIDGADVTHADPVTVRRQIGYVIQHVGLFPHQTIRTNVGTVPRLLRWSRRRTQERVDELLELVGLPPEQYADRYPNELSGGQRQRVGVARALAADPVVLLMDEPFSAVDPIVRGRLQEEFLRLQDEVRKTIVLVTHDLDEAVRLGDRIAVLSQGGTLEQYAEPAPLLGEPETDFVRQFVGTDRGIRRLAVTPITEDMLQPGVSEDRSLRGPQVHAPHDGVSEASPRGVAAERMGDEGPAESGPIPLAHGRSLRGPQVHAPHDGVSEASPRGVAAERMGDEGPAESGPIPPHAQHDRDAGDEPEVALGSSLYDGLAAMLTAGTDRVRITDPAGEPLGQLTRDAVFTSPDTRP